jgi:hypothetical protein
LLNQKELSIHNKMEEDSGNISKGRGRGRGGKALLPEGMWDSLNSTNSTEPNFDKKINILVESNKDKDINTVQYSDKNQSKNENIDKSDSDYDNNLPPREFGRSSSNSSYRGREDKTKGFGNGNSKGQDWDCLSCGNTNWSWRTSCNACQILRKVEKKLVR